MLRNFVPDMLRNENAKIYYILKNVVFISDIIIAYSYKSNIKELMFQFIVLI